MFMQVGRCFGDNRRSVPVKVSSAFITFLPPLPLHPGLSKTSTLVTKRVPENSNMATKAEDITPTTLADVVPETTKGDPATAATPATQLPASTEKEVEKETLPVAGSEEKKIDETAGPAATTAAPTEELEKLNISNEPKEEATVVPAAGTTTTTGPTDSDEVTTKPEDAQDPLSKFFSLFPDLVEEAGHDEVYGIQLSPASPFQTKLILQKFLRANKNDLAKAKQQLLETLKWRKEFDPIKAASETFSQEKFGGLGYIIEIEGMPGSLNEKDVVTFNIYGAVKDNKKTFGDVNE
jgi:hypothetical protein